MMIAIDLSKKQALCSNQEARQQIDFAGNLAWVENEEETMFFIIEEAYEAIYDFSQVTVRALWIMSYN